LKAVYEPQQNESRWRQRWEEIELGRADPASSKPAFSIALPPPNITGSLHMGHALNAVVQDTLCRYHRMRGFEVCWVPGTDHAAIATQNVIERQLADEGSSKEAIGREAFDLRVAEWYRTYQGRIVEQLRRMGASCDWSRERFTLDDKYVRVIRTVFKSLYDEGLIYRGPRIVNWCPRCGSAISDEEVEYQEHQATFFYVRYLLTDGTGEIVVATTRPETILADVAVAVPPGDPRFQKMVGRDVMEPLSGRQIPVIEDEAVDPKLGTGALKITPGHSAEDFEVGLRHGLPSLTVISLQGRMLAPDQPDLDGLEVEPARERAAARLRASGAMVKEEPLVHQVGHCDRCGTVLEPLVTPQWWVRIEQLARPAAAAVESNQITMHPGQFRAQYLNWIAGLRDWCISRQLWLGHHIPVSNCANGHTFAWVQEPASCPECQSPELTADPDVLDTWFSSALWPFAILGWPEDTPALRRFYPTSVVSTARDILRHWVVRMVMMGLRCTGEIPFHDVIFHSTILGADGARMSKSKGNVVDPLDLVDRYGADALRAWGASVAVGIQDAKFDESRVDGFGKFANKLWNMVRLLYLVHFPEGEVRLIPIDPQPELGQLELADRWLLSRLAGLTGTVSTAITNFEFGTAVEAIRQFAWHELADWYLELVKDRLEAGDPVARWITRRALLDTVAVLHPIMPFLTEACGEQFEGVPTSLDLMPWPESPASWLDPAAERAMAEFQELTGQLRIWLQELGVRYGKGAVRVPLRFSGQPSELASVELLEYLTKLAPVEWSENASGDLAGMAPLVVGGTSIYLAATTAAESPQVEARLRREHEQLVAFIAKLEGKLNTQFAKMAPAAVVERERDRLEAASRREALLRKALRD
jgi:valyl-tRNA synthetase